MNQEAVSAERQQHGFQTSMNEIWFLPIPVLFFLKDRDFLKILLPFNLIPFHPKSPSHEKMNDIT
jgi:hypothetical protein